MEIDLIGSVPPPARAYKLSPQEKRELQEIIKEELRNGMISKSESSMVLPLFFVSKQIRLEAQCALAKYNKIGFVALPEQMAWLAIWNRQILQSLRDLVIVPWDIPILHLVAGFIKENCDIPQMSISIHDSAHIDTSWEDCDYGEPEYMARQVELYKAYSGSYRNFAGVKDFFVYLLGQLDDEPMYEKIVMGENYDSLKRGKLKSSEREPSMPWCRRKREIGYDHLYHYSWEPPIPYTDRWLNIGRLSSIYGQASQQ